MVDKANVSKCVVFLKNLERHASLCLHPHKTTNNQVLHGHTAVTTKREGEYLVVHIATTLQTLIYFLCLNSMFTVPRTNLCMATVESL